MKYATIIPLIGGMTLGHREHLGEDPQFLLSHSAFAKNDSNLTSYLGEEVPWYNIDEDALPSEELDFVSSVCPCAGLSQLNSTRNDSEKKGSDAKQNDWMYGSARLILEKYAPKVYWGENAPGLYTPMGQGVVENLKSIAREYGYSFSLVKTSAHRHGLPQIRHRSFYFFWKGDQVPMLDWYEPMGNITIDSIVEDREYEDELSIRPTFQFVKSRYEDRWKSLMKDGEKNYNTLLELIYKKMDDGDQFIDFCHKYFPDVARKAEHIKNKNETTGSFWDWSPRYFRYTTGAMVGMNFYTIHPWYDRFLNQREIFNLMGFPEDFSLYTNNINHIAQNVPVPPARDFTREVQKFINGESELSGYSFLKQDNINKRIDKKEEAPVNSLF